MGIRLTPVTTRPVVAIIAIGTTMLAVPAVTSAASAQRAATHGWRIVKTFKTANLVLDDVVAVPGGRAWVSGSVGSAPASPVFFHRTRARWVRMPRPGIPATSVFARDVSASSDSNVWSPLSNSGAFDHWNGHHWNRFSFGTQATAAADGVLAVGTNRAWAFTENFSVTPGQASAHFFNGSTWTSQLLPAVPDADFSTDIVSASSRSDIWTWAIDPVLHSWEALHFNGKKWAVVKVPARLIPHHGTTTGGGGEMLAESAKNVWATVVSENLTGPIVLLHRNGKAWRQATGHRPAGELIGPIAPDGHGGLWLVAARAVKKFPFLVQFFVHYRNGIWTTSPVPASPLGPISVSGIALIPGTRSLWAVGTIQKGESTLGSVIIKFGK